MSDLTYSSLSLQGVNTTLFGTDAPITINGAWRIGTTAQSRGYSNGDAIADEVTPGDSGLIFSTGRAEDFSEGSGDSDNDRLSSDMHNQYSSTQGGDSDIEDLVPGDGESFDSAGLIVNFTATESGTYKIPLTFLTEEYPYYYGSAYTDSAAVFLGDGDGNNMQLQPVVDHSDGYFNLNSIENGAYLNNGDTGDQLTYNTDFNAAQHGMLTLEVEAGQTYTLKFVVADINDAQYDSALMIGQGSFTAYAPPCFVSGTLIETPQGPRAVEDLVPGDLVLTRDHGTQVLRWHGTVTLAAARLARQENLRPVRIDAGALAPGLPRRALHVSQQHRILVTSRIAERMFGAAEVLVAAKHLVGLPGITLSEATEAPVTYHHLMFDAHEVVLSEGAASESLHLGPEALRALPGPARAELLALFPALTAAGGPDIAPARPVINGRRGRVMRDRHLKNHKPLQSCA